jgi:mono/diheme cytochrome c family protein
MNMKRTLSIAAGVGLAVLSATPVVAGDGKALYKEHCAKCHGADGKGNTKMGQRLGAKDYSDPKTWEKMTDAAGTKAIREGLKDKDGKVLMKPTEGVSDADAKAVMEYMKSLKQ